MRRFMEPEKLGSTVWECSTHAICQFIERNKFLSHDDWEAATSMILDMIEKAIFIAHETRDRIAEVWVYGQWIFVTKESTVVTAYPKKGSKFEKLIVA